MGNLRLSNEGLMLLSRLKVFLKRDTQTQLDLFRFTHDIDYARLMLSFASQSATEDIVETITKLTKEIDALRVENKTDATKTYQQGKQFVDSTSLLSQQMASAKKGSK